MTRMIDKSGKIPVKLGINAKRIKFLEPKKCNNYTTLKSALKPCGQDRISSCRPL